MKKNTLLTVTGFLLSVFLVPVSAVTMIGDDLTIRRAYPDTSTDYVPPVTTTVTAGSGDIVSPQPIHFEVDPEAISILIDFNQGSSSGFVLDGASGFDGLIFSGFSNVVSNASVSVDTFGLTESILVVGNEIQLDLGGNFSGAGTLLVDVEFAVAGVPEPVPGAALAGGLALLLLGRRTRVRIGGRS